MFRNYKFLDFFYVSMFLVKQIVNEHFCLNKHFLYLIDVHKFHYNDVSIFILK